MIATLFAGQHLAAELPALPADTQVIHTLEVAGLHLCDRNTDPQRAVWCGCAPGRCMQEAGNG